MSEQSEQINELATALAKAQGEITGALKDSSNPFFKSKYADLAACWDACRVPLSKNGIAVVQIPETDEQGVSIVTTLTHTSGQWMRGKLRLMPKDATPQGIGSCITYGRRYALAAFVGLAQVDDDGNAASGKGDAKTAANDPAEKTWNKADTKKARAAAERIITAMNDGHDVMEIWNEFSSDHEFTSAVWANLPAPVKNFIRDEKAKAA